MQSIADSISIKLTHRIDEDGEYNAFTSVTVDIMLGENKIGHISATLVDRQLIPKGDFFSAMDGCSDDLQWIAVTLFEQKYGRTTLQSLVNHDDPEFLIMYIEKLHLNPDYKLDSDIAASAIRKLLFHPFIKGNESHGDRKVSCAIYILDSFEQMTPSQEEDTNKRHEADVQRQVQRLSRAKSATESNSERMHEEHDNQASELHYEHLLHSLARTDASAFLRAGFYQDPSVARLGRNAGNLLVASHDNWSTIPALLTTHAQAQAVTFAALPLNPGDPVGHDAGILEAADKARFESLASADVQIMTTFRSELVRLIGLGGSVTRSHALHEACDKNDLQIVSIILDIDSSCINDSDASCLTPLMVAVLNVAGRQNVGRQNVDGFQGGTGVIDLLLRAGALKDTEGVDGMTAYGYFKKSTNEYAATMTWEDQALQDSDPGRHKMELKLMPSRGPTTADSSGGLQAGGFVSYSTKYRQYNPEISCDSSGEGSSHYYIEDRNHGGDISSNSSADGGDPADYIQKRARLFF